eukprot:Skav231528  [mRNA]  locus=scaffold84:671303:674887:- [translate_table: standard]
MPLAKAGASTYSCVKIQTWLMSPAVCGTGEICELHVEVPATALTKLPGQAIDNATGTSLETGGELVEPVPASAVLNTELAHERPGSVRLLGAATTSSKIRRHDTSLRRCGEVRDPAILASRGTLRWAELRFKTLEQAEMTPGILLQ